MARVLKGKATCAVFYLASAPTAAAAVRLHDGLSRMFQDANLSVNAIEAVGHGDPKVIGTSEDLVHGLATGQLEDFTLLSLPHSKTDFADWRAIAWLARQLEVVYLGIVDDDQSTPIARLRDVFRLADGLDLCYGIAYSLALSDYPDCYAIGESVYTVSYAAKSKEERDRLAAWSAELYGPRRHLSGYFRGAYPASILSEAHLRRVDLRSHRIGSLCPLASGLWLRELADSELQEAEAIIDAAGALIN